jgi:hypothetical protein
MIDLTCWSCGWDGRVPDRYAGLRVICKRCRSESTVPCSITRELFLADWVAAVDPGSESATVEFDARALAYEGSAGAGG